MKMVEDAIEQLKAENVTEISLKDIQARMLEPKSLTSISNQLNTNLGFYIPWCQNIHTQ